MKVRDLSSHLRLLSPFAPLTAIRQRLSRVHLVRRAARSAYFGNLVTNRIQYNFAGFYFLEKDTNCGLNTFNARDQQVCVAKFIFKTF